MAIWPWKIGIQLGKRGIIRVYDGWFDYPFDYLFEATTAVTEGSVSIYSCSPGRPGWILQLICKKKDRTGHRSAGYYPVRYAIHGDFSRLPSRIYWTYIWRMYENVGYSPSMMMTYRFLLCFPIVVSQFLVFFQEGGRPYCTADLDGCWGSIGYLVGGWPTDLPILKNMSLSMGRMTSHIWNGK